MTDETLYVTDEQIIERLGVSEKVAAPIIRMLDLQKGSGFPAKQKMWGMRRYWPAVKAYLDRTNGLTMDAPQERRERHG